MSGFRINSRLRRLTKPVDALCKQRAEELKRGLAKTHRVAVAIFVAIAEYCELRGCDVGYLIR